MAEGFITRRGGVAGDPIDTDFIQATGGDVLFYEENGSFYKSHTFASSGNFVVNSLSTISSRNQVDYLIIAGGGGGSGASGIAGGAGGAGGFRTTVNPTPGNVSPNSKITVTTQTYGITIGAGGVSGANFPSASNGSNSSALGITSTGGGKGGDFSNNGASGGSGGGGPAQNSGTRNGGTGTSGQGTNGGLGGAFGGGINRASGGGGGAGGVGIAGSSRNGGNGGPGLANSLRTGKPEVRAAGGGGSTLTSGTEIDNRNSQSIFGLGGSFIGGNGDFSGLFPPTNGIINTGSGGGGITLGRNLGTRNEDPYGDFYSVFQPGGSGSSGIVVIRYEVGGL